MKHVEENKYFDLTRFEQLARAEGFPIHEDIIKFLKKNGGTEPKENVNCFTTDNNEKVIEHYVCLVDNLSDYQDNYRANFDIGYILTMIEERLWFESDFNDDEIEVLRLIPFAYLFSGDFLCYYFETDGLRPKIVVWSHEESEEFAPVFEIVAGNIDEFVAKKLKL